MPDEGESRKRLTADVFPFYLKSRFFSRGRRQVSFASPRNVHRRPRRSNSVVDTDVNARVKLADYAGCNYTVYTLEARRRVVLLHTSADERDEAAGEILPPGLVKGLKHRGR